MSHALMKLLVPAGLVVFAAAASCGGSTTESDNSGTGGSLLDSSLPETSLPESGADSDIDDTAADVSELDASDDVSVDQSVEPEAAVPDAEDLEASLFDLTMPDVVLNDSGATVQGCYDCAVAQCDEDMQACDQDESCRTMLLCMFTDQCWGGASGIDMACALGCASQAGISSPNDPAVQIVRDAGECIGAACAQECALPAEGGL